MEKILNYNVREKSIITNCSTEVIYTLKDFPIHMMKSINDFCVDLVFEIGEKDGFIQLRNTINSEDLYIDTHSNAIGKTWAGAHTIVAEIINQYCNNKCKVLEIGGATGRLNKIFCDMNGQYLSWEIIEPQPCPIEGCKATFIKGFFPNSISNKKYDIVVHTHVIEHLEDIHSFIKAICKCIKIRGRMIFSLPDMAFLMKNNVTSILNFEHTILITEEFINYLLNIYGFEIEEKTQYGNGHSLIYSTVFTGKKKQAIIPDDLYIKNKQMFMDYIQYHKHMIEKWNNKIIKTTKKIYLFGAHISTQYFSAYGLNMDKIEALLDNDTSKQNKRVSGIEKDIYSPKILKNVENVVVIIPNNPYREEIKEDILQNINQNVEFWE